LVVADGNGLRLAGARNIVKGREVVEKILRLEKNYKVFYLGGKGGVSQKMAEMYGGEWDEGAQNIKFEIRNLKSISNIRILNKINKYKPDLLLVAYGAPWQEKWLRAYSQELRAKVVMGVGGTFDYLAGKAKLPPKWMEKLGLEWLWRLIQTPGRWKRQVNLIRFLFKVAAAGK
jgi:N-acetylglucosaminyldiphosphoundecaprenol N-acetyl-beta-D-mannosaminyltransferase